MPPLSRLEHADYLDRLNEAVAEIFPVLCFDQDQIDSFLKGCEKAHNYQFFKAESECGCALVCVNPGSTSGVWSIVHIIPTAWERCYETVADSIREVILVARMEGAKELLTTVLEDIPSHNAYYGGMLPQFGFIMKARLTLIAPLETLDRHEHPALPQGMEEVILTEERLEEAVQTYVEAFSEHDRSEEEEKRLKSAYDYLSNRFHNKLYSPSWVALQSKGKIVALCFGCDDSWTGTLDLVEMAVLPSHRRMGLGRYLCLRCMQKLRENFPTTDRRFLVGTDRTNLPAINLYRKLGFKVHQVLDYASCRL